VVLGQASRRCVWLDASCDLKVLLLVFVYVECNGGGPAQARRCCVWLDASCDLFCCWFLCMLNVTLRPAKARCCVLRDRNSMLLCRNSSYVHSGVVVGRIRE
jgi:hypothetical protein